VEKMQNKSKNSKNKNKSKICGEPLFIENFGTQSTHIAPLPPKPQSAQPFSMQL